MVARAIVIALGAFLIGTGLAALAEGNFDPCFELAVGYTPTAGSEGVRSDAESVLWPPGRICSFSHGVDAPPSRRLAATVPETLVWIAVAAGLLVARRRRRSPLLNGAVIAAGLLGLAGWSQFDLPFVATALLLCGTAPVVAANYALHRDRGLRFAVLGGLGVLFGAVFVWGFFVLLDQALFAVLAGIAAAGGLNAAAAAVAVRLGFSAPRGPRRDPLPDPP